MLQNKKVIFRNLGTVDYQAAWDYQEKLFADSVNRKIRNRNLPEEEQPITPNYLLFCEHPHVYTLGKSGDVSHLLLKEEALAQVGARFYKINRGGDITYHGPGQLVGYPILDLENFFTDIHRYLRLLEEAIIRTLADYGLDAGRVEGLTGVWLDYEARINPRKICAMGVKSSRWVTMHGFAFNIQPDLSYFNHIIPCGIADKAVTSLAQEVGQPVNALEVAQKVLAHLATVFGMELVTEEGVSPSFAKR